MIPPEAFPQDLDPSYIYNLYREPVLFQVVRPETMNASEFDLVTDTEVIGFSIPQNLTITNLSKPVVISFQSLRARRGLTVCIRRSTCKLTLMHYYTYRNHIILFAFLGILMPLIMVGLY